MPRYLQPTLVMLLIIAGNSIYAQQLPLQIKVTDEAGNPVVGASIYYKGPYKSPGTATYIDGIVNTSRNANIDSLVCSHASYSSKTEYIKGNTFIHIVLEKRPPKEYAISLTGTHTYTAAELKQFETDSLEQVKKLKNLLVPDNADRVFTRVEMQSEFPGGSEAFMRYITRSIENIDSTQLPVVQGTVKVNFTITKDGSVGAVTLLKGIHPYCDSAVIAIVQKTPKWNPALQNGRNVSSSKELSVYFDVKGIYPTKPLKRRKKQMVPVLRTSL